MNSTIHKPVKIASLLLVIIGVVLLTLAIIFDGSLNIALPIVFMLLGGAFFILAFAARQKLTWAPVLFIPGGLLIALGIVLLFGVITGDDKAWAYSWLLLIAGLGVGLILASRGQSWRPIVSLIGWGMLIAGITFFAVFGAIAGGLFIQIMAPVMIIFGGLLLYWLRVDTILSAPLLHRLHLADSAAELKTSQADQLSGMLKTFDPLSARELEVLRLVDEGLSNQQIALRLSVAQSTIKTHINNIYSKLEVQSRVQAIRRARELGLVQK